MSDCEVQMRAAQRHCTHPTAIGTGFMGRVQLVHFKSEVTEVRLNPSF
jgi:hypothetical protein